ncbi:MAG: MBL fold metallo-hydrolase [Bryobacteraceae bacterium]|nr:MBL fold metallo-hydrolase [Bryobacteraceae bacterium]
MSRTYWVRLATALAAAGSLWLAASQAPPPADLTVTKVADDLHVIVGSGGNVAVLTTEEGVILVDDKFERNVPEILAKVRTLTDKPVRYVLNTHQHGDHTGGNAALIQTAEIVAHKNARANMVKNAQPGVMRMAFSDEFELHLAGKEVRARHLGLGHTNGDAVMHFPKHRVVHTGDLFVRGTPFIDYANGGSSDGWMKTLDNILALDFDRIIPGHGDICGREELVRWKASFETIRGRVREMSRAGKSLEEVTRDLKVDDQPGWSSTGLLARSLPGLYEELSRGR